MRKVGIIALVPGVLIVAGFQGSGSGGRQENAIITLERAALDRWGKGDPTGYLETYAPEITYFDPMQERRVDGLVTMQKLYGPIAGKVKVESYEMLNPKVQGRSVVAVLSYNLVSHARTPSGEPVAVRWNSTEVYARSSGKWSIIHSHWSFTKPSGTQPPGP